VENKYSLSEKHQLIYYVVVVVVLVITWLYICWDYCII